MPTNITHIDWTSNFKISWAKSDIYNKLPTNYFACIS